MVMPPPSPEHKLIARYIANAFSGSPAVQAFHHDAEPLSIDIISCDDRPTDGMMSVGTIRLSDHPMLDEAGDEFPTRLELVGISAIEDECFKNVIAAAAFQIIRHKTLCVPGKVLYGYVREYFPNTTVPHLYFTAPFLWESELRSRTFGQHLVSWLCVVPISTDEALFLREKGDDALETLLQAEDVDVCDLQRSSAI